MSAPTAGYTSESIPVSTAMAGAGLRENTKPLLVRLSCVKKSSERASTMSATQTAHTRRDSDGGVSSTEKDEATPGETVVCKEVERESEHDECYANPAPRPRQ